MTTFKITIESLNQIDQAAEKFAKILQENFPDSHCITFYGEMGAGKTTFISALCKQLGSTDEVSSPTFSIINNYKTNKGEDIFHFDLYRISSLEEAMAAGAEEYIYGNNYCFIEWPQIIENILPDNALTVEIKETENSQRTITISLNKQP